MNKNVPLFPLAPFPIPSLCLIYLSLRLFYLLDLPPSVYTVRSPRIESKRVVRRTLRGVPRSWFFVPVRMRGLCLRLCLCPCLCPVSADSLLVLSCVR